MTSHPLFRCFLTIAAFICMHTVATAATLQAKVIEVESGNRLVVINISRPLRVRIKAIAPPEAGQPFADVAREHLKALVLNKEVSIEYTNLFDGYLDARVFLNGVDIGTQMIRDGVAWYEQSIGSGLSANDQGIYAQCEQAARGEKRGLWVESNPTSPWDFRKAQLAKLESAPPKSVVPRTAPRSRASNRVLTSDYLGNMFGGSSTAGAPAVTPISENGSPDRWMRFDSPLEHFSILVPSNSVEGSFGVPVAKDNAAFHFLTGGSADVFVIFLSARGPALPQADAQVADDAIKGLIEGMNQGASDHQENGRILKIRSSRAMKIDSLSGKQYSLVSEESSGIARVLTRKIGESQEVFVAFALTSTGHDDLVGRFMNSFKLK